MNIYLRVLKPFIVVLSLVSTPALLAAQEGRPPLLEVGKSVESDEVSKTMVLHQRVAERTLNTEAGIREIPFSVELLDTRPVDQWYEAKDASVTFHFSNDLKLQRVVISE
ncbi:MAG: hypothetical protein CMK89_22450 [Pseudomonadales bacterium]|nr:hypothetical protein [Pseudomonadales bacterium]